MKIEILIENGKPLVVFPEQLERDKSIVCYSQTDSHVSAARAYLRTLKKPAQGSADELASWRALRAYCDKAIYIHNLHNHDGQTSCK